MRLLYLLPAAPDPPDAGAKIRNLGLLRLAAERHDVDVVTFGSADDLVRLQRHVRHAVVVPPPAARSPLARVRTLVTPDAPDLIARLGSAAMQQMVRAKLAAEHYDVVQAEGLEMAPYLDLVPEAPDAPRRIYDAHNAEYLLQRRIFERAPRATPRATYSLIQWRRLERYERRVTANVHLTLTVSQHDADALSALHPAPADGTFRFQHPRVIPNGIELASFPFHPREAVQEPTLLFLGKLDFRPNAEGLAWFLDRVLPGLFERVPNARFFVVGANPPDWLVQRGQADNRIAVTGYVADERPYLDRATAFVLPLQVGGGSRLKALVAWASGLPIVSTALGLEGLAVEPGQQALLAEEPTEWVDALTRVLEDRGLAEQLASAGRDLVERCYDWPRIAPSLERAYASLNRGR